MQLQNSEIHRKNGITICKSTKLTNVKKITTMTKAQIVNEISKSTGIEKANVLETVEKFMEVVKDSLANGENFSKAIIV